MLRFSGAGMSDAGRVRDHNEDSGFMGPYLALVADGVGGAAAGEVASATAAYAVSALALSRFGSDPVQTAEAGVQAARKLLVRGVELDLMRSGMATTMTALLTDGRRLVLAHVGDSRGYAFRDGALVRVTRDHTYVQKMVDEGQLEPEAVGSHPWRNVVLRSLHGNPAQAMDELDIVEIEPRLGDRYLLCSDGLTDMVGEDRIAELLRVADPQAAAAQLIEEALRAGGIDNVTCLVFDVVDGPQVSGDGQLLGAVLDPKNIVDAGVLRSA